MKKTYLSIIILLTIISLAFPLKSFADTSCQPIYGGGQTCVTTGNISINKTVMNPQNGSMVDNLSINDPHYQPGSVTTFQIAVTNTGNSNISRINVKDVFPQYITFSSGPGSFDNSSKTLTFEVDNLAVNETRNFTILAKVVDGTLIPINQGASVCIINQATATNIDNNAQAAQDNAQFCIEKTTATIGFPAFPSTTVTVTPSTGPESLALFALIPTGITGLFLRKKSIKKEAGR
jgi:uncharacterized repeat protein (TIGR01451 family)